jgi:hypothetical protein
MVRTEDPSSPGKVVLMQLPRGVDLAERMQVEGKVVGPEDGGRIIVHHSGPVELVA